MQLALVSFTATDKVVLPGLLYAPEKPTKKLAIWLHGMGDNGVFYRPARVNALGRALTAAGIGLLAFNNRGAHNTKRLTIADETLPEDERGYQGGTFFEKMADCMQDINGAAGYATAQGFSELYLLGHSSGANKICAYHARAKHNPFHKYILAGPGDDTGLFFEALGEKRYWKTLKYAAQSVSQGDELKIMPRYTGMYPFSAQSAWDILNPDGDYNTFPYYEHRHQRLGQKTLFQEYNQLDRPTLIVIGEQDESMSIAGGAGQALDILLQQTSNANLKTHDFTLIPGADHSFHDHEDEFAAKVAEWLST